MNRRRFLQVSGLASAATLAPAASSATQHAQAGAGKQSASPSEVKTGPFTHPGILQTSSQLAVMKRMIQADQDPVATAWKRFIALPTASLDFKPTPAAHVFRSANGAAKSGADEFAASGQAAHNHALQFYVTGDARHAQKAIEILDAWSHTLWDFTGNDAKLLAGWTGAYFCEAAELLRAHYPAWNEARRLQFRHMLTRVLVPLLSPFFPEANGNWDGAIAFTLMAIAIYCDDHALFNHATHHVLYGPVNAGILKYVWPTGQCEESCRDQGHTQLGLGYFSYAALVAFNQGVDLFAAGDNRLALGFEYTSRYMLGEDVPHYGVISPRARGHFSEFYEAALQHYRFEKKMDMPYTVRAAEKAREDPKAFTAVWLFRGGAGGGALAPAPVAQPQAAEAGAHDVDTPPQPAWHRVNPGESLQGSLDAAGDGATIWLAPGIHTLPTTLNLRGNLTIVGCGRQSMLHLAPEGGEYCMMQGSPKLNRLTLRNFLIEGAMSTDWPEDPNQPRRERSTQMARLRGGILLNGNADGDIRDINIEHVTVRNCVSNGIAISGSTGVRITACDLTDNGGSNSPGFGLNHNLLLNHVADCTVSGNRLVFSLCGCGASVQNATGVTLEDNDLSRNTGFGAEFLNCTGSALRNSLLEANDAGAWRSEKDGAPSELTRAGLVERLNGS